MQTDNCIYRKSVFYQLPQSTKKFFVSKCLKHCQKMSKQTFCLLIFTMSHFSRLLNMELSNIILRHLPWTIQAGIGGRRRLPGDFLLLQFLFSCSLATESRLLCFFHLIFYDGRHNEAKRGSWKEGRFLLDLYRLQRAPSLDAARSWKN